MTLAVAFLSLLAAAPTFSELAKQADAARDAGKLDQAAALYRKALALRPAWPEGQWHLASILYQRDRYAEAQAILVKVVQQQPDVPQPWAILGLCEYHTGAYEDAAAHLGRALRIGLAATPQMQYVVRYHSVLLLNRLGRHEEAWPVLIVIAQVAPEKPELIEAAGLTGLRIAVLPKDIPADKRDLVAVAGRAMWMVAQERIAEARPVFDQLLREHDKTPGVHYMVGSVLLVNDPDAGVAEMLREVEISPQHAPALTALALEYLKRREPDQALKWAERAAAAAPKDFAARTAFGRALVDTGQAARGVKELEAAVALAPDVPQVRFSLASAYRRLGREQDAKREQAEFLRLRNQRPKQP